MCLANPDCVVEGECWGGWARHTRGEIGGGGGGGKGGVRRVRDVFTVRLCTVCARVDGAGQSRGCAHCLASGGA